MGIVEQYFLQLKKKRRRWCRTATVLTVLSVAVAVGVVWNLRMTGITIANSASCGMEEHQHSELCQPQQVPICGYEETQDAELTDHVHTADCYETVYLCGLEEHIHTVDCYADETADLETCWDWESGLPELTEDWSENLVLVARSQLGQGESQRNYILAEDGLTRQGITRYGQWYGNPYGQWSAMFTLFCLHYGEIPPEAIPQSPGVDNMMALVQEAQMLLPPDENMGACGNLVFLDTDDNQKADQILIVTDYFEEELTAIGGDLEDRVAERTLWDKDPMILGYLDIRQAQSAWLQAQMPEEAPEIQEEKETEDTLPAEEGLTEAPAITLTVEEAEEEGYFRIAAEITGLDEALYLWQWQYSQDGNEPWIDMEGAVDTVCLLEDTEENALRYYRIQGRRPMLMRAFAFTAEVSEDDGTVTSGAIMPFSIDKSGNRYTIDVYGLPVDENGNRISSIEVTDLGSFQVSSTRKISVDSMFDEELGTYHSAYFGTETQVEADDVDTVWRYRSGNTYYLAYAETDGTQYQRWKSRADSSISLYLRYTPLLTVRFESDGFTALEESVLPNGLPTLTEPGTWTRENYTLLGWSVDGNTQNLYTYEALLQIPVTDHVTYRAQWQAYPTVTFQSEDHDPVTQQVAPGSCPTLTEPGTWTREGYTLAGWIADGDAQTVYTYEEILGLPVTEDVTYTAIWRSTLTVSFDLGAYLTQLYAIEPMQVAYGGTLWPYPVPVWRNNAVAMAFDGWYLNQELTEPAAPDYVFYEDTVLYAKWSEKDDGYYVYFMDFYREGQAELVLVTYSVTEGRTAAPYTPGNAPEGTQWDGVWYLDAECTEPYNFAVPVSDMTSHLSGANCRDLYLYPGTEAVCRAIFVTYGTKIDPVTVPVGGTVDLDRYRPERDGYEFAGWTLKDGTPVEGKQLLSETTTYYAAWNAGYVPFEAILRIENANDTGLTQADILGTWYAKAGSQIRVNSTYSGTGSSRTGTHEVVCVLDGTEYPVYTNEACTREATLADVYNTYFIYNNTGTAWTDEVNWDDVYTGGEVPCSTRPVSSAGDTIINFDYMRVRNDIVFTIPNSSAGAYIDVYKLYQNGLITGSVTYTGTTPTAEGQNVSAEGVSGTNVTWSYTAASRVGSSYSNYYTLHNMKYGQRIYEVYPVGASWLTPRDAVFHWYKSGSGSLFSSRREDLSGDFFSGSGRQLTPYSLTAVFDDQNQIALMYAIECLADETPDFTLNGVGYKVQPQLCEVVNHSDSFSQKELLGCEKQGYKNYGVLDRYDTIGDTSAMTLFGTTYWDYYKIYDGVTRLSDIEKSYIFYYTRIYMDIQFNFSYDSNGDGASDTEIYENIFFGERIEEYQFGMADFESHPLLDRPGYEFVGWLDANGFVLEAEDWASMVATGDSENSTMIFIAKWEKISNNIVEYYEDRSAEAPFETHYFDDGQLLEYPTMAVYPQGWVWQEYGQGQYERFDWDVPMYGEYGVQELREIGGEEVMANILRIYGTWDDSHTVVIYDPNAAQGGIPGTEPVDSNEYTIWRSEVPVMEPGTAANGNPELVFAGWLLDRDGVVYQPGDHVPVRWPRTMIFTAQWALPEQIVYLRYDPNGGTPEERYPNDVGFSYKKDANASVWNNTNADGTDRYTRQGHIFTGWNTAADGSGTAYDSNTTIVLTESLTTLYAQWEPIYYSLSLHKQDSESGSALEGAVFSLYLDNGDHYTLVEERTTGTDGHITFSNLETGGLYKLVEEKPPNGYAIVAKEICFRLLPGETVPVLEFCDSTGAVTSIPNGVIGEFVSGSMRLNLTVSNIRGYALPATGGPGNTLFILCGLILMSAPLVYGLGLRRKDERRHEKRPPS